MTTEDETITPAVDARLRRFADKQGYALRRSRWHRDTIDNLGGYRIVDPFRNVCLAGERFDLDASDVEAWLTDQ